MKTFLKFAALFALVFVAVLAAFELQRVFAKQEPVQWREEDSPAIGRLASFGENVQAPVDFRAAARKITHSVVSVDTMAERTNFLGESVVAPLAAGSGVVVSADGYIVTNFHVVAGARSVRIRFSNGQSANATLVGEDARTDIAVLKVNAPNLQPIEMGSSKNLEIGEWVLAVGNPLGYENTVSVGVVSSLGRTLQTAEGPLLLNLIQTDAAINQGNSGGALANAKGQLVGINSAIASNTGGGSIGIGFAIPVDNVRRIVNDIVKYGHARHGVMGLEAFPRPGLLSIPEVRAQIRDQVGAEPPKRGIVVRRVNASAPAAKAGIRPLDVLISIDNQPMEEPVDLIRVMADKLPGDKVAVKFWSKGEIRTQTLVLEDLTQS